MAADLEYPENCVKDEQAHGLGSDLSLHAAILTGIACRSLSELKVAARSPGYQALKTGADEPPLKPFIRKDGTK
jgi:hypothetical protein